MAVVAAAASAARAASEHPGFRSGSNGKRHQHATAATATSATMKRRRPTSATAATMTALSLVALPLLVLLTFSSSMITTSRVGVVIGTRAVGTGTGSSVAATTTSTTTDAAAGTAGPSTASASSAARRQTNKSSSDDDDDDGNQGAKPATTTQRGHEQGGGGGRDRAPKAAGDGAAAAAAAAPTTAKRKAGAAGAAADDYHNGIPTCRASTSARWVFDDDDAPTKGTRSNGIGITYHDGAVGDPRELPPSSELLLPGGNDGNGDKNATTGSTGTNNNNNNSNNIIRAALCYLDGSNTRHFDHFPHAAQSIFPCWSFFRRVLRRYYDRRYDHDHDLAGTGNGNSGTGNGGSRSESPPLELGFWFGGRPPPRVDPRKRTSGWTRDLILAMGACQVRRRGISGISSRSLPSIGGSGMNVTWQYATLDGDTLVHRIPDRDVPWFYDVPRDKEALKLRVLAAVGGDDVNSASDKAATAGMGAAAAVSEKLSIGIVDRASTRQLANVVALEDRLRQEYPEAEIEIAKMEGMAFGEQVRWWSGRDVVVCGHGAAMTNVAFMRRGSVVVEIFPPRLRVRMFEALARKGGVSYRSWSPPPAQPPPEEEEEKGLGGGGSDGTAPIGPTIDLSTLRGRAELREKKLLFDVDAVVGLVRGIRPSNSSSASSWRAG